MRRMSDSSRRRWFQFRIRTLLLLTLLTVIGLSVYSYWSDYRDEALRRSRELLSPPPGSTCEIILRADILGLSEMSPTAHQTSSGVSNAVYGTLVMTNDQWIVLAAEQQGQPQRWIPRENVLMLQVDSQ
jgi:hypothetical protein